MIISEKQRLDRIARELIRFRRKAKRDHTWPWLSDLNGERASKRVANKFFLGAVIDYQMKADVAWKNAERFAEEYWRNPNDLWPRIAAYTHGQWMRKWRRFGLHRFPQGHMRVWRIARVLTSEYGGDARRVWEKQTPGEVLRRLMQMRMGPQLSRMVVGALIDTKQIRISGESRDILPKADSNVCRVLGRSIRGKQTVKPSEAAELTLIIYPRFPWKLDISLFAIGTTYCSKTRPECSACPISTLCRHHRARSGRAPKAI